LIQRKRNSVLVRNCCASSGLIEKHEYDCWRKRRRKLVIKIVRMKLVVKIVKRRLVVKIVKRRLVVKIVRLAKHGSDNSRWRKRKQGRQKKNIRIDASDCCRQSASRAQLPVLQ
jgi:hypothetical protein